MQDNVCKSEQKMNPYVASAEKASVPDAANVLDEILNGEHIRPVYQAIEAVIKETEPYAIIYLDVDNFKAYNDAYGFAAGDAMLKALAQAMVESCSEKDFIGHIGGDDFVIITRPQKKENVHSLCENVTNNFAELIKPFYSPSDWERGYIISKDRNGLVDEFPIATLSMAVITNYNDRFNESAVLSKKIAEVKKKCKQQKGNAIVII